jgi:hypothetical protein
MEIIIKEQLESLRGIRNQIGIFFGFISVMFSVILNQNFPIKYPQFFSILSIICFVFLCFLSVVSTFGLKDDKLKNIKYLNKLNSWIRTEIMFIFLTFIYLIVNKFWWIN